MACILTLIFFTLFSSAQLKTSEKCRILLCTLPAHYHTEDRHRQRGQVNIVVHVVSKDNPHRRLDTKPAH